MSNIFTLESLDEEIAKDYAPLRFQIDGEEIVLRSLLRVPRKERDAVIERLKELEREEEQDSLNEDEALQAVQFVLQTVAEGKGQGDKLVKALGNDLLRNMKVLERWTEVTQPGEAKNSPS